MAALPVAQQAIRSALAAPVEDRGREAARGKIPRRLEILFDALVAARQQDDRALERAGYRREAAIAQLPAVETPEIAACRLFRRRVAGNLVKPGKWREPGKLGRGRNFAETSRHGALSRYA